MALAGVAAAEVGSTTYSWVTAGDDTTNNPSVGATSAVMGGNLFNLKGTTETGNFGYLNNYGITESGTDVLYNAITAALTSTTSEQTEATALTLNFCFAFGSTDSTEETQLIQIGYNSLGIGLALYQGKVYLTSGEDRFTELGSVQMSVNQDNGNRLNEVAITFANGGYTGTINTEGADDIYTTTTFSGVLSSSDLTWHPTELEYNTQYAIGSKGPGWWPHENLSANSVLLKSASATVTTYAIPEPTTATLSLLALVGLAARRRRQASR
jgi:MYXO-CTERM domain-containing protein